jgi:hypothetical protein
MAYSKRLFWLIQTAGFGPVLLLIVVAFSPFRTAIVDEVTGVTAVVTCAVLPLCASMYDGFIALRMRGTRKVWLPAILCGIGILWVLIVIAAWSSAPTPGG